MSPGFSWRSYQVGSIMFPLPSPNLMRSFERKRGGPIHQADNCAAAKSGGGSRRTTSLPDGDQATRAISVDASHLPGGSATGTSEVSDRPNKRSLAKSDARKHDLAIDEDD